MTIRILIADDHQMVRLGLRAMLETEPRCEVVGEASTGDAAVALAAQLRPDVLVTDMVMPGLAGLDVIRQARQAAPGLAVLVYSMHAEERYVREALRAGATAYVLKESPADELVEAVRHAAAGQRYLSAALSQRAIDAYARPDDRPFDPYETLTEREREVLTLAARGLTSGEIAEQLKIGARTVDSHRMSLMRKLGLRSLADLVRFAVRRGIVPLDE
jgi:DNA-binding NarL/FixJ family response regulator